MSREVISKPRGVRSEHGHSCPRSVRWVLKSPLGLRISGLAIRFRSLPPATLPEDSKRPFGQTPVSVVGRQFLRRDGVLRPFLRVLGALFVGGVKEKPAGGSGVEQLSQPARQLPVVQVNRRPRRVTEAGQNLARRPPGAILDRIDDLRDVVAHGRFIPRRGTRRDETLVGRARSGRMDAWPFAFMTAWCAARSTIA